VLRCAALVFTVHMNMQSLTSSLGASVLRQTLVSPGQRCQQSHATRLPAAASRRPQRGSAHHASTVVRAAAQQQQSLSSLRPADGSRAAHLKAEIVRQAGSKNGTDLTLQQHAAIKHVISELEALSPTRQVLAEVGACYGGGPGSQCPASGLNFCTRAWPQRQCLTVQRGAGLIAQAPSLMYISTVLWGTCSHRPWTWRGPIGS